jgi:SNF2 family DNA or RNA helicase
MKYSFKTRPYEHQRLALQKLLKKPRGGGLFMEMGTGKTKVAIDFACVKELKGEVKQVLVLGPLSTLGVWDSEIRKHAPDDSKLNWKVINYDKARMPHYLQQLRTYCRSASTLLICDEAHKLKNPQSKQSKAAYVLGKMCACSLVLTGTPITKHPLDLFGELRVVDDGILGSSWGIFKKSYAVYGGYGGYQLIKFMNLKQLRKRIEPHIFQARKDDCLDLPKRTHEVVPIDLHKSRRVYEQMARDSVVEFENGQVAEAPIVLTRLLRLSQCTGGYLRTDDGKYQTVGMEKKEAFSKLVEEFQEQERTKIVIFVRFLNELRDCSLVCAEHGYKVLPFYGGVSASKRTQRIAHFDETSDPVAFVAQIQAGSLGISLTAASEAIFYSHTYDYAEFAQACDRLHRIGQSKPVTYYHLIARDTVDEAVWLALKTKRNIAELVMHRPELLI